MFNRHRFIALFTAAGITLAALAGPARAGVLTATARLVPQAGGGVNQPLAVDIFLSNIRDTDTAAPASIIGVDLDFGGVTTSTTPLAFAASPAPGFTAAGGFAATFSNALDASLADGHAAGFADLAYAAPFPGLTGFAANGGDLFVGTLYVTAAAPGRYTLSLNHGATLVQSNSASFDAFGLSYADATFDVAVPEPAGGLAAVTILGFALRRLRRISHAEGL